MSARQLGSVTRPPLPMTLGQALGLLSTYRMGDARKIAATVPGLEHRAAQIVPPATTDIFSKCLSCISTSVWKLEGTSDGSLSFGHVAR